MKIAIAVITYNPDNCVVERINKYSKLDYSVLVFDNSEEKIDPKIALLSNKYWHNGTNIGMSGALKQIFQYTEGKYDYVLTMDQDTEFNNSDINALIEVAKHDNEKNQIGIYCPNNRKIYRGKNGTFLYGKKHISETGNMYVRFSMTSASLVNCDAIRDIKFEDLFIGYVDNDLSYELLKKGYKIKMIGSICMNQHVGKTLIGNWYNKIFRIVNLSDERYYYMVRNNLYLQNKNKINRRVKMELKFNLIRILINILIGENRKIRKIRFCFYGWKDFKKGELGKIKLV